MNEETKSYIRGRIRQLEAEAMHADAEAFRNAQDMCRAQEAATRTRALIKGLKEVQKLLGADDVIRVSLYGNVEENGIVRPMTKAEAEQFDASRAREVQHVDTDEPEAEGIPPHVWLYRNMLTELQAVAPLGRDETNGQYAVAIDDLTNEQRAIPHVAKQLCDAPLSEAEKLHIVNAEKLKLSAHMSDYYANLPLKGE